MDPVLSFVILVLSFISFTYIFPYIFLKLPVLAAAPDIPYLPIYFYKYYSPFTICYYTSIFLLYIKVFLFSHGTLHNHPYVLFYFSDLILLFLFCCYQNPVQVLFLQF